VNIQPDLSYPDPQVIRDTYRAWERFLVYREVDPRVKPYIVESWKECADKVNPHGTVPMEETSEFRKRVEKIEPLLRVSQPVVRQLAECFAGTKTIVILGDERGCILETLGEQNAVYEAQESNIVQRGFFAEDRAGTNGLPLALKLKRPVLISQTEHYMERLHKWTCFSVPIMDHGTNQPIGVLDITENKNIFQQKALSVVMMAANSIEKGLWLETEKNRLIVVNEFFRLERRFSASCFAAFDSYGRIVAFNPAFRDRFLETGITAEPLRMDHVVPYLRVYLSNAKPMGKKSELEFTARLPNDQMARHIAVPCFDDGRRMVGWLVAIAPIPSVKASKEEPTGSLPAKPLSLIGRSRKFQQALALASKAAHSDASVLLLGETGTGKEVFAETIHQNSPRRDKPFIAVNCGAIPRELIASELFGYDEGAFSGAKKGGNKGKFELADGGTLFLDEIGELPLESQVYLLRALQTKRITRLGGTREIAVNVRIIAATNVDLHKAATEGRFRLDLLFRLNVLSITLPSLIERGTDDIMELARYFLCSLNQQEGKQTRFSEEVWNVFFSYHWPGNVRELKNVIHQAVIMTQDEDITVDDLPSYVLQASQGNSNQCSIEAAEKQLIQQALLRNKGNFSRVAKELGISRSTLYRKIEIFGI
jgi:transcriptional regulator of acetoin/glycerol metabolism